MPELAFKVAGVRAMTRRLAPLLQFRVNITNSTDEVIRSILLHVEIQIQCAQRGYNGREKENLVELFGTPAQWGRRLRNYLWTSTNAVVGNFERETEAVVAVPCTYDVTLATTKYFYGLESGEIPLMFLFSGTVFYSAENGPVQTQPISWNTEVAYRMPLLAWKRLMEEHFPNCGWLRLRRDVFDRLYTLKRENADASWEQTIERLLSQPKLLDAETTTKLLDTETMPKVVDAETTPKVVDAETTEAIGLKELTGSEIGGDTGLGLS